MFIYRGISTESMGLILQNLPPLPLPQKRKEKVYIPDKSGYLTYENEVWSEFSLPFEGHFFITESVTIETIKDWLMVPGELFYKNENFYYEAEVLNQVEFEYITETLIRVTFLFWCQPFMFLKQPQEYEFLTSNYANPFDVDFNIQESVVESEAVVGVYGTGDQTLTINGAPINLKLGNDNIPILLNSKLEVVTKGHSSAEHLVEGALPLISVDSIIGFSEGIEKITIKVYWRRV